MIGLKKTTLLYEEKPRVAGESKYTLKKMINLASNGVLSLSTKPISIVLFLGLIILLAGLIGAVISMICNNSYATILLFISIMCGLTILSMGIFGEYIGKVYTEVKHRPRYIISEVTWENEREKS